MKMPRRSKPSKPSKRYKPKPIEDQAMLALERLLYARKAGNSTAVIAAIHALYIQAGVGMEEAEYRCGSIVDHRTGKLKALGRGGRASKQFECGSHV
jgi:hypothetical protein